MEWKQQARYIEQEAESLGYDGRFGAGPPRINDGSLLFLQHMRSKMRKPKDGPERAEPRARQNAILETGMLLSSLTRSRMAIVVKGHVELPSDLQGIIRFGYNDHVKEVVPKLCQRLKEAGFDLQPSQIAAAAQ